METLGKEKEGYFIARYTDEHGNTMERSKATEMTLIEYDSEGNPVNILYKLIRF